MSSLHLIRHAEPAIRKVLLGATDPPLTPAGRTAALRLQVQAKAIYTSPLLRARETAEALSPHATVISEFAEIRFGDWDGLPWVEVERRWPDLARAKQADWLGVVPPGGESWTDFLNRVRAGLTQIREFPAAIVAHLAVNAAIAHLLAGRDPLTFQQDYCEVISFDISNTFLFR